MAFSFSKLKRGIGRNIVVKAEMTKFNKQIIKAARNLETRDRKKFLKRTAKVLIVKFLENTPVDTGRARAGWYAAAKELKVPIVRKGSSLAEQNRGASEGVVKQTDFGLIIDNNVPYIIFLEFGYSPQSPLGIVRPAFRDTVKEIPKILEKLIEDAYKK